MLRLVLADDHAGIHPLIRRILGSEFEIVDAVLDGRALVESALANSPDVLVVDISMPGLSGIEAIRSLGPSLPKAVVVLTTHADPNLVEQAFRAGASGYVLKAKAAMDLAPAIHAALRGERFVSAS